MLAMETFLAAVEGLTQDEVKQLYTYLVERHLQGDGESRSSLGAAWTGDNFDYEWSGEFWLSDD